MNFTQAKRLSGEITVPGDKSISHRSIMLGSLATGVTEVDNFLQGADCLSSISCFRQMGIDIENNGLRVHIRGRGLHGLSKPKAVLDVGNSGTTTRLMSGILSAQSFDSIVNGDASIQQRPMKRIIEPLTQMGAHIVSKSDNGCTPLEIHGKDLHGIDYLSPIASAQIKSAILLAGLYANGTTSITEPYISRNHTELMFQSFGIPLQIFNTTVQITPLSNSNALTGQHIYIPGDISSAAYFIVAGLITPNSTITIHNVGTNPTRDGILEVCKLMGANIAIESLCNSSLIAEPVSDITVSYSNLHGITIGGSLIPRLIDELPVIAVLACFATGTTIIKDAQELKVKESNRIETIVNNLSAMGADIEATEDGMIIRGGKPLHGATIQTHLDHRIAMSFAIAGMNAEGRTTILDGECVTVSYPSFYDDLESLQK